jgi:hypothetical protein
MAYDTLTRSVLSTLSFDAERSRLELGGAPFGFHADAYNTRVLRICEDMMGYQEAGRLLYECAEATTYALLKKTVLDGPGNGEFQALGLTERLEAVFEIYKALAYGAIFVAAATPDRARFNSASSYLAEAGWRTRNGGTWTTAKDRPVTTSAVTSRRPWPSPPANHRARIA